MLLGCLYSGILDGSSWARVTVVDDHETWVFGLFMQPRSITPPSSTPQQTTQQSLLLLHCHDHCLSLLNPPNPENPHFHRFISWLPNQLWLMYSPLLDWKPSPFRHSICNTKTFSCRHGPDYAMLQLLAGWGRISIQSIGPPQRPSMLPSIHPVNLVSTDNVSNKSQGIQFNFEVGKVLLLLPPSSQLLQNWR